jgi:hypothetical protein
MVPTRDVRVKNVAESAAGLRSCTRRCLAAAAIEATSRSAKQVGLWPEAANFVRRIKSAVI